VYHLDPAQALEELIEDAQLVNPVLVRDMIIRSRLNPQEALERNREFLHYQQSFAAAQQALRPLLEALAQAQRKEGA
jgi:hypothetical protein